MSIVRDHGWVESVVSANQDAVHAPFGGVVPEIASRNHSHHLLRLVELCFERAACGWDDIDGLCVTNRPGLIGSLLVGLITVKKHNGALPLVHLRMHKIPRHCHKKELPMS